MIASTDWREILQMEIVSPKPLTSAEFHDENDENHTRRMPGLHRCYCGNEGGELGPLDAKHQLGARSSNAWLVCTP